MVKKTTPPEEQSPFKEEIVIDLSPAWLINDNTLEPQPERYIAPQEHKFKAHKEFEELITANTGLIFGKNTLLVDVTQSTLDCYALIDYSDPDNHVLHLVDMSLAKENFWQVFARVSRLFTALTASNYNFAMANILEDVIKRNKELFQEVANLAGYETPEGEEKEEADISGYVQYLFNRKPFILLVSDEERPEMKEMQMTYPANWGKSTVSLTLQKFMDEGVLYLLSSPLYSEIEWNYGKSIVEIKTPLADTKGKAGKTSEEDHLQGTQTLVQDIYKRIKGELLNENAMLEFNPKTYYIALRKGKNLAFFHIRKKSLSIVVMNPEADTRKVIKNHEIKTLTPKVQQFWNGECCTVNVARMEKVEEVIGLLKKLVK